MCSKRNRLVTTTYDLHRHSTKLIFSPPILAAEYILQETLKELSSGSLRRETEEWKRRSTVIEREENAEYCGSTKSYIYIKKKVAQAAGDASNMPQSCTPAVHAVKMSIDARRWAEQCSVPLAKKAKKKKISGSHCTTHASGRVSRPFSRLAIVVSEPRNIKALRQRLLANLKCSN